MAIRVVYGPPGSGKGAYMAYKVDKALRQKRKVFSTFAINRAIPLITLADALCEDFSGALLVVDELGSEFDSRQTMDLDRLIFVALTQHRKGGIDVLAAAQSPAYVDVQIRRVVESYIHVRRFGPDGRAARNAHTAPPFWRRPWCWRVSYYSPEQYSADWDIKPGERPYSGEWLWWDTRILNSYDTFERVIPAELGAVVRELQSGAASRANLPPYIVRNGRMVSQALPEGYELLMPPRVHPKKGVQAPIPVESAMGLLETKGFFRGEVSRKEVVKQVLGGTWRVLSGESSPNGNGK